MKHRRSSAVCLPVLFQLGEGMGFQTGYIASADSHDPGGLQHFRAELPVEGDEIDPSGIVIEAVGVGLQGVFTKFRWTFFHVIVFFVPLGQRVHQPFLAFPLGDMLGHLIPQILLDVAYGCGGTGAREMFFIPPGASGI